ncbi:Alpha/beta-hydrolase [Mycena kentingensis (nom. inval.)]|nr:Alpha/beta-hydrolase [Mycena kentingensis (nom. inval.)]
MAQGFTGSVVLTQDSIGHASISGPSVCTFQLVREYFVNGTLPAEGTVCPVSVPLFPEPQTAENSRRSALSAEDLELVGAGMELARMFAAFGQGKPM